MLRIGFPGGAGEDQLEHPSWNERFERFEEENLAFLYPEQQGERRGPTFFKLVSQDRSYRLLSVGVGSSRLLCERGPVLSRPPRA